MEIPDVKPNSNTVMMRGASEIDKTVGGATLNKPIIPKKGITSLILPEDVPDMQTYIRNTAADTVRKIIVPKIKELLLSTLASMLHLNGYYSGSSTGSSISATSVPRVSYNNLPKSNIEASSFYEDIRFDPLPGERNSDGARERADSVMNYITDYMYENGKVTIDILYDVAGLGKYVLPAHSHYGWTTLTRAKIVPSGSGYILQMPYPRPI